MKIAFKNLVLLCQEGLAWNTNIQEVTQQEDNPTGRQPQMKTTTEEAQLTKHILCNSQQLTAKQAGPKLGTAQPQLVLEHLLIIYISTSPPKLPLVSIYCRNLGRIIKSNYV